MANHVTARAIAPVNTIRTGIALLLAAVLLAAGLAVIGTTTANAQDPVKVGVMFTQLAGDKGPVDDMIAKLERAEEELGVDVTWVEAPDPSTYEGILRNLAQEGNTLILPTNLADIGGMVAAATSVIQKTKEGSKG